MNILSVLESTFTLDDALAFFLLGSAWIGIGRLAEVPPQWRPSVSLLMQEYRYRWMAEFVTRQPRLCDVSLIDSLRQGTAFFASAPMIAIGGGVALIGSATTLQGLAQDLTLGLDAAQLRVKLMVVVGLLTNALLKFIWSHRLFAYCAIMMAAVLNDPAATWRHPGRARRPRSTSGRRKASTVD